MMTDAKLAECMLTVDDPLLWGRLGMGTGDMLRKAMRTVEAAATAAESERIADLWAGCTTDAEGHGPVDIGESIRAGKLVDA